MLACLCVLPQPLSETPLLLAGQCVEAGALLLLACLGMCIVQQQHVRHFAAGKRDRRAQRGISFVLAQHRVVLCRLHASKVLTAKYIMPSSTTVQ